MWNVLCKVICAASHWHLWKGCEKQICNEIFKYLNPEIFFSRACTLDYVSYIPFNFNRNDLLSLGSVSNKHTHTTSKIKKRKVYRLTDAQFLLSCNRQKTPRPSLVLRKWTFIILNFQHCRLSDWFPSFCLWLQRKRKKKSIFCMGCWGASSEYICTWISWVTTLKLFYVANLLNLFSHVKKKGNKSRALW